MVVDKLIKLAGDYALKLIAKKFKLQKLLDYVEKPNDNNKSIDRLFTINQSLESRVGHVERTLDSKRKFVICEKCKCQVKEDKKVNGTINNA